jgi:hypothetical protein
MQNQCIGSFPVIAKTNLHVAAIDDDYVAAIDDDSSFRLNFDQGKGNKIQYHS